MKYQGPLLRDQEIEVKFRGWFHNVKRVTAPLQFNSRVAKEALEVAVLLDWIRKAVNLSTCREKFLQQIQSRFEESLQFLAKLLEIYFGRHFYQYR